MKRVSTWLTGAMALVVAAAFFFGNPVAWGEAALIMLDVAAGGAPALWQDVTRPPSMYPARWTDGEGDLYMPGGKVRAAMVLVPGAAVLGRSEPRLQAFARTFARAGFAVLVPELPEVRQLRLSRGDADRIAAALRQLHMWQPTVPLGVAAISYAVAPTIIATLQDDLVAKVSFIAGVGGYRDAESVIRFVTTGVFRPMGSPRECHIEPHAYGRWAFLLANAGRLDDPDDERLLEQIARTRFRDPQADTARLASGLGPRGRAPRDRCARPCALRPVEAAQPPDPGAWARRYDGALQRKPGAGGGGCERARGAVPDRRHRPRRAQRREPGQWLVDGSGDPDA